MIFYFTGTGNSLYGAQKISEATGERVISISESLQKEEFYFELQEDEMLGFVVPVYAWDLPEAVSHFLKELELKGKYFPYVFGVFTCGAMPGCTKETFSEILTRKNLAPQSVFSVPMPDNYIVSFPLQSPAKQEKMLDQADVYLKEIIESIQRKEKKEKLWGRKIPNVISAFISFLFNARGRKTRDFYAEDTCIHCGLCEKICPSLAIELVEGRPVWKKEECAKCLGCLHRCPVQAIQCGKNTKKKGRYINPRIRF